MPDVNHFFAIKMAIFFVVSSIVIGWITNGLNSCQRDQVAEFEANASTEELYIVNGNPFDCKAILNDSITMLIPSKTYERCDLNIDQNKILLEIFKLDNGNDSEYEKYVLNIGEIYKNTFVYNIDQQTNLTIHELKYDKRKKTFIDELLD